MRGLGKDVLGVVAWRARQLSGLAVLLLALTAPLTSRAGTPAAQHGGTVYSKGDYSFEVVHLTHQIRVYVYDSAGKPVDLSLPGSRDFVRGSMHFGYYNGASMRMMNSEYLFVSVDRGSKYWNTGSTFDFEIYDLPGTPRGLVKLETPRPKAGEIKSPQPQRHVLCRTEAPTMAPRHGGVVLAQQGYQVEVVSRGKQLSAFLYDASGQPIPASVPTRRMASGSATLGGRRYMLRHTGGAANELRLTVPARNEPQGPAELIIGGLPDMPRHPGYLKLSTANGSSGGDWTACKTTRVPGVETLSVVRGKDGWRIRVERNGRITEIPLHGAPRGGEVELTEYKGYATLDIKGPDGKTRKFWIHANEEEKKYAFFDGKKGGLQPFDPPVDHPAARKVIRSYTRTSAGKQLTTRVLDDGRQLYLQVEVGGATHEYPLESTPRDVRTIEAQDRNQGVIFTAVAEDGSKSGFWARVDPDSPKNVQVFDGKKNHKWELPESARHAEKPRTLSSTSTVTHTTGTDGAEYVQIQPAKGTPSLRLRYVPGGQEIRVDIVAGANTKTIYVPHKGGKLEPRIVESSDGLVQISLRGGSAPDWVFGWKNHGGRGSLPYYERGRVILKPGSWRYTTVGLAGADFNVQETYDTSNLGPNYIRPPVWEMRQVGTRIGWARGNLIIPHSVYTRQVGGARFTETLFNQTALATVRTTPIVGNIAMLGEAAVGRELFTGRKMDPSERVIHGSLAGIFLLVEGGAVAAEIKACRAPVSSGAKSLLRISDAVDESQALVHNRISGLTKTGLTEDEARAVLRAIGELDEDELRLLRTVKRSLDAGRAVPKSTLEEVETILQKISTRTKALAGTSSSTLKPHEQEVVELLQGSKKRPLPTSGPELDQAVENLTSLKGSPLQPGEVIADTQTTVTTSSKAAGKALDPNSGQSAVWKFLEERGLVDKVRYTQWSAAELRSGKIASPHGIQLTTSRQAPAYQEVISELERYSVGAKKGLVDRRIVADSFFAEVADGKTPTLITQDRNVYNNLYRIKAGLEPGSDLRLGAQRIWDAFPDGFEVTVKGKTLKVIPIPPVK